MKSTLAPTELHSYIDTLHDEQKLRRAAEGGIGRGGFMVKTGYKSKADGLVAFAESLGLIAYASYQERDYEYFVQIFIPGVEYKA